MMTTDEGYLVPSLVLAEQLTENVLRGNEAVIIFLLDLDVETHAILRDSFDQSKIRFLPVGVRELGFGPELDNFFRGHVPVSALARLAIAELIPEEYEDLVYLDGDMQIVGDIGPLINAQVPAGQLAACVENFILTCDDIREEPVWAYRYLRSLGIGQPSDYLNSGLLAFSRSTWLEVAPEAMRFFLDRPDLCKHHDQSALNAVCRGAWLPISPAYNYNSFFQKWLIPRPVQPRIVHFSSSPKPWQSDGGPWPQRFAGPYHAFLQKHPLLGRHLAVRNDERLKFSRGQLSRIYNRSRALLERGAARRRFGRYMSATNFLIG